MLPPSGVADGAGLGDGVTGTKTGTSFGGLGAVATAVVFNRYAQNTA